jgi:hypothetical protein
MQLSVFGAVLKLTLRAIEFVNDEVGWWLVAGLQVR